MNITHRVKVVKTDSPKGGYCGCGYCKSGLMAKYKNDGFKVDGIIPSAHDRYFLNTLRRMGMVNIGFSF